MSKAETLDALMESALDGFARHGYEGASLRDVAKHADVPLSTIHFYFGSKSDMFVAVRRKAWVEVDEERGALLEEVLAQSGGPTLERLVYAIAYPIVRRALSKQDRDLAVIYVLRSLLAHSDSAIGKPMIEMADRSIIRWIEPMMTCCPGTTRADMIWAFSFVVGAIYSWQIIDHRYDQMLGLDDTRTADDVIGDIIAFCVSGVEAMAQRSRQRS